MVHKAVNHTLDRMAIGGMYDHIGGGFHRYSVDEKWLVPHFEKMLYDNGQLLSTYARAYELTGDALCARVLRQTGQYILREMLDDRNAGGAFCSAQDAEVHGREGENYLWTSRQLREALAEAGANDLIELAMDVYGFRRGANFRDPHHPEDEPKNVVHLVAMPESLAASQSISVEQLFEKLDRINAILLNARDRRDQPALDDKIIAGWNGLMIAGLADAGRVLHEQRFIAAATSAAAFVLSTMRKSDGGLLRTWRRGAAGSDAFLEDYAFVIHGLLGLHRANGDASHIEEAVALCDAARHRFWDDSRGGYFNTLASQPDLFVRTKGIYDGAVPSGNGMMMINLLTLAELTGEQRFADDASAAMRCFAGYVANRPATAVLATLALHRMRRANPDALQAMSTEQIAADDSVVQVHVQPQSVDLASHVEVQLTVTLSIAEGYHICAHDPGMDFLVPLKVAVAGQGIEADVQYPQGEALDEMLIHTGEVVLSMTVRRTGTIADAQLLLRYQPCRDDACLEAREMPLPVSFTA